MQKVGVFYVAKKEINKTKTATSPKAKTKNKKKLSMLVIRIGGDGTLQNSKPCLECFYILQKSCVRKIYYSVAGGICYERVNQMSCTNHCYSSGSRH